MQLNINYQDNPNYSNGPYGLVDAFYRNIWLPLHHEPTAHKIRQVFWSKVPTIVFDLSKFTNWNEQLVDSDVSLDWQIPVNDLLSPLTQIRFGNPKYFHTQTNYVADQLINQTSTMVLSRSRQQELQSQMLLYKNVFRLLEYYQLHSTQQDFYNHIDMIFQTYLHLDQITLHLTSLAKNQLKHCVDGADSILHLLGACYDE
jgi:hypothetical protein